MFIGGVMFELNKDLYTKQKTSISEFVFVINGILNLSKFHEYTKGDIEYCHNFIKNKLDIKYPFMAFEEAIAAHKVNSGDKRSFDDKMSALQKENDNRKTRYFPDIISKLEVLTDEQKNNICSMITTLKNFKRTNFNGFPTMGFGITSTINEQHYAYQLGELITWINENIPLTQDHGLPLTSWANEMLTPPQKTANRENNSTLDGYVEISTLPKIMQFMIECYQDSSFQQSSMENNSKQVSIFKSEKVDKLYEISKQKRMTHTSNRKKQKGISPTALKYIINFIQKD